MTNVDAKRAESRRNVLCCEGSQDKFRIRSAHPVPLQSQNTQKKGGEREREKKKVNGCLLVNSKEGKNLVSFHFPHSFYSSHLLSL